MGKKKGESLDRWSKDEINLLYNLVDVEQTEIIYRKINYWHEQNKTGITRSKDAVKGKILSLGFSTAISNKIDNMTPSEWSRKLGVSRHRVNKWIKISGLAAVKLHTTKWRVSLKDLTDFAHRKPYLFSDIAEDILKYYFDSDLVRVIKSDTNKFIFNKNKPMAVKRLDTNQIFPSLNQASESLGMTNDAVRRELKRKGSWLVIV